MMRVTITTTPTFAAGTPQVLFQKAYYWGPVPYGRPYDIGSDGRFLMIKEMEDDGDRPTPSIVVVLNWFEELKRLVLTK